MDSGILITVNLLGKIGPRVKHTTKQIYSADISPIGGKPEYMTRKIEHTDRGNLSATREMNISPDVVRYWQSSECPSWSGPKTWKKLTSEQRIQAYVARFDEGYGVSYE